MRLIDGDNLYAVLENIAAHLFETKSEPQCSMAQTIQFVMGIVRDQPDITSPPNDPLTMDELREMDGEPVYGADGECYIVNVQNEYAADKYRGFRMLWEEGFFYRRKPEEG